MNINLILISASLFTWGLGEGLFFYFIPLSLQEWGADPILIGAVLGGLGLAISIAQIPAGWLSDRFGPRYLLWAAWTFGAIAASLMAYATSLWMFIIGLWLYYFSAFAVAPMNSYIVTVRGKLSIQRALTLVSGFFNIGAATGPLIGGLIAEKWELQSIYKVSTVIFFISTILIFFISNQQQTSIVHESPNTSSILKAKFLMFVGLAMITVFILYLPQPLTSNYLNDVKLLSETRIGLLGSIGNVGNALAALALGGINPMVGLILGQASVLVYSTILWLSGSFSLFSFAYFVLGGYRLARIMITSIIRTFVADHQVGLGFGILETACGISIILAPILAGFLFDSDPALPYKVSIPLIILLIIFTIVFVLKTKKRLRID